MGEHFLDIKQRPAIKRKQIQTLHCLAKKVIMDDEYKLIQLQILLATAIHREKRNAWFQQSPIHMWAFVPNLWGEDKLMKYFSYPEYCVEHKQIEHCTLDYTHILTNMKTHILNKGYDLCKQEHFQTLATENPELLSRPLVFGNIDQQNAYNAQLMFSENVEKFMLKKGYTETAEFIKLVRHWHTTCDSQGVRADVRVMLLYNMYSFLTERTDFNSFPFPYTGCYW